MYGQYDNSKNEYLFREDLGKNSAVFVQRLVNNVSLPHIVKRICVNNVSLPYIVKRIWINSVLTAHRKAFYNFIIRTI